LQEGGLIWKEGVLQEGKGRNLMLINNIARGRTGLEEGDAAGRIAGGHAVEPGGQKEKPNPRKQYCKKED
jgi:hypothetical protein